MTLDELDTKAKECYTNLDMEGALRCYAAAFSTYPKLALAYNNYGCILRETGYPEQAYGFLENAIHLDPDNKDFPFNLSVAHLAAEDFPLGWKLFEARWKFKQHEYALDLYDQPRWEGQDLKGKRLLITCEEGDGDNLQFSRFTKYFEDLGCSVIHQTEPNLVKLFTDSFKNATVVSNKDTLPEYDYWTPILSIPAAMELQSYNDLPKCEKYLKPSIKSKKFWKNVLGEKTKPRIGFSWNGRTKQFPFGIIAEFIDRHQQFEWINLQAGMTDGEFITLVDHLNVRSFFEHINDWSDTAGLVSNLDAVITIDTGLSHLAGGMGVPCFVLLDRFKTCWRWMYDREDTPWYKSVTLVRQPAVNDFNSQLHRLSDLIQNV
jgi:tetratricopeptide (TPR) repeat protein